MDVPFSAGDSHLSLAEGAVTWSFDDGGGLNAGALMTPGDVRRAPVAGLAMSYRPSEAFAGVRAGWLAESEIPLGTETGGCFGRIAADAMFAGFDAAMGVGAWQFLVDAEIGVGRRIPAMARLPECPGWPQLRLLFGVAGQSLATTS